MNAATTRAAPSSSVRTTELKPGRRRADPIARITGRSGPAKPAGIANYKPSVAALEISRMHAPGSRRARELAAREGLARATADVGRVPDVDVVESLTNAIRAAEATGRPGEGHSGFIAAGLLSRAANELRAATRREGARADLAAAAAEGRASAGAVRRALALGIAGTDPAVRAMDEAVRVAEAVREREAAAAAAELRREIEGSGAEPTLARSPENEGEDGTHAEDPEDGTLVSSTERVLRDDLEVLGTVGEGAYGVVMRCRDRVTGETVAVKKIANAFEDAIDCKRTLREIRLLQHFNHENVLNLRDIMLPPAGALSEWNDIYLALELMDTDLHYIIHSKLSCHSYVSSGLLRPSCPKEGYSAFLEALWTTSSTRAPAPLLPVSC